MSRNRLQPARSGFGFSLALATALAVLAAGPVRADSPLTVLHTFDQGRTYAEGVFPETAPIIGPDGALYGTANEGGDEACEECGTVYALTPNKQGQPVKFEVIHVFAGGTKNDGEFPSGPLTLDADGNLFGVTEGGGSACEGVNTFFGCGVAFEEIPPPVKGDTWTHKIIYRFKGGTRDGALPVGPLLLDKKTATFYGTTCAGGASLYGTVFSLVPSGKGYKEKLLFSFPGGNGGGCPEGALARDKSGNLYGATRFGGQSGLGTVFRLSLGGNGWKEKVLHSFAGKPSDGAAPAYGVLLDKDGNLFGTTEDGGADDDGTVFELSPNGSSFTETILHSFATNIDGTDLGPLSMKAGNLYGTTQQGDSGTGKGTIFTLTKSGASYNFSTLYNFCSLANCADGLFPDGGVSVGSDGHLFGTTSNGGPTATAEGTVFEFTLPP